MLKKIRSFVIKHPYTAFAIAGLVDGIIIATVVYMCL